MPRLAAQRVALHRRNQAERHPARHGTRPGAFRRGDPQRLLLRPGLLRDGGQRHVLLARRGRGAGPQRLPARHGEQVVPPVLRAGAHLRRPLRRGAEGLPPATDREPERPGQLPHPRGALRTDEIPRAGHHHARFGRAALRAHPAARRDETAAAPGHRPGGAGHRGGPQGGRGGSLRSPPPRRAGHPLRGRPGRIRWPGPSSTRPCASTRRTSKRS